MEGMKERIPTEEGPREAPYEPLKSPVTKGRRWKDFATGQTLFGERRRFGRGGNSSGV
jgi:hypothetical protein